MFVLKVYNIEGGIKVERNLYKRIKKLLFWDKILRNEEFLNFIYRYDIGYRICFFFFKCICNILDLLFYIELFFFVYILFIGVD